MTRSAAALLPLVQRFFEEHLGRVRGASPHTQRAYRDALRLFLLFAAQHRRRPVARLGLADVEADTVLAFLAHLEEERSNSPSTRNARLAALRSFAAHLLRHDVGRAEQYRRILSIPSKRARVRPAVYLEPAEARVLLAQPDTTRPAGRRDAALLLLLYNTGARVSEALAVGPEDLHLSRPRQVRLRGKGGRERVCPLWADTACALQQVLREQPSHQGPLFRNAAGAPLSRDGVAYLLRKYTARAQTDLPALRTRRVTPHVLRHSCAVALLQAGVDLTVIRDYLGHASINTTGRYLSTNLEMKREVLEAFWQRAGLEPKSRRPWKPSPGVLAFLESL